MKTKTRKPTFDRTKVVIRNWTNGIGFDVIDSNKSSRCVAEVLLTTGGKSNCRIDRAGKPWKYAANIPTENPESAYEYTRISGEFCE